MNCFERIKSTGRQCPHPAIIEGRCRRHHTIETTRIQRENSHTLHNEIIAWALNENDGVTLDDMLRHIAQHHMNGRIRDREYGSLLVTLYRLSQIREINNDFIDRNRRDREPPRSQLEALTRDNQNVHTSVVNNQTSSTLEKLLDIETEPQYKNFENEVGRTTETIPVLSDIETWYNKRTCRNRNDHLYQRVFDGLWVTITKSAHKKELTQRLLEEAHDSLGMCCEGHISRLCNVLVGFDETVQPEISVGELLQQKMAAISGMDLSVEHKVGQAWTVFEELKIPMNDREAWIEAL